MHIVCILIKYVDCSSWVTVPPGSHGGQRVTAGLAEVMNPSPEKQNTRHKFRSKQCFIVVLGLWLHSPSLYYRVAIHSSSTGHPHESNIMAFKACPNCWSFLPRPCSHSHSNLVGLSCARGHTFSTQGCWTP